MSTDVDLTEVCCAPDSPLMKVFSSWMIPVWMALFFFTGQLILYLSWDCLGPGSFWTSFTGSSALFLVSFLSLSDRYLRIPIVVFFCGWGIAICAAHAYFDYSHCIPTLSTLHLLPQFPAVITHQNAKPGLDVFAFLCGLAILSVLYLSCRRHSFLKRHYVMLSCGTLLALSLGYLPAASSHVKNLVFEFRAERDLERVFYFCPTQGLKRFGYTVYLWNLWRQGSQAPAITSAPEDNPLPLRSNFTAKNQTKWNIILIQVESLDNQLLGQSFNDIEITPFLNSLREEALYFPNFFAQHCMGGSSDAELASLTGLVPLDNSPAMSMQQLNHLPSVVHLLNTADYYCVGMHGNTKQFWNRGNSYLQLGFNEFLGAEDLSKELRGNMPDSIFFEQAKAVTERLTLNHSPFLLYLITLSTHGPFNLVPPDFLDHRISAENDLLTKYLRTAHYADASLKTYYAYLNNSGILEDTAVVIFGDHVSGATSASYSNPAGRENVPLFLLLPNKASITVATYGSHIDIAPTLVDLAGLAPHPAWFGRSLIRWFPDRTRPTCPI